MNDRAERLRAEAWRWLQLALENLTGAELRLRVDDMPVRHACYWAQQAAETALKAVLVAEDVDPPRSHNLVELAESCRAPEIGALDNASLKGLTAWAVGARYAPIGENAPEFEDALRTARMVLDTAIAAVERQVGTEPTQPAEG